MFGMFFLFKVEKNKLKKREGKTLIFFLCLREKAKWLYNGWKIIFLIKKSLETFFFSYNPASPEASSQPRT